ncbi:SHSP domain-containing protein [Forsythia ovata]|uniref:SHSP domain-containing protein n=1 Tax=Forsythia ovata TaxID=205694 RepID=A0ABD1QB05_9LAMI
MGTLSFLLLIYFPIIPSLKTTFTGPKPPNITYTLPISQRLLRNHQQSLFGASLGNSGFRVGLILMGFLPGIEDGVLTVTVPRSYVTRGFFIDPEDMPQGIHVLASAA